MGRFCLALGAGRWGWFVSWVLGAGAGVDFRALVLVLLVSGNAAMLLELERVLLHALLDRVRL